MTTLTELSDKALQKLVRDTLKFNKQAESIFMMEKATDNSILISNSFWLFRIMEGDFPLTIKEIRSKLIPLGYSDIYEKLFIKKLAGKEPIRISPFTSLSDFINKDTTEFLESTITPYTFNVANSYLRIITNKQEVFAFNEDYIEVIKEVSPMRYQLLTLNLKDPLIIYDMELKRNEGLIMPIHLKDEYYEDMKLRFIIRQEEVR